MWSAFRALFTWSRVQGIMGFFILITQKSTRSENSDYIAVSWQLTSIPHPPPPQAPWCWTCFECLTTNSGDTCWVPWPVWRGFYSEPKPSETLQDFLQVDQPAWSTNERWKTQRTHTHTHVQKVTWQWPWQESVSICRQREDWLIEGAVSATPCLCLHLGTRLTKLLNRCTKNT